MIYYIQQCCILLCCPFAFAFLLVAHIIFVSTFSLLLCVVQLQLQMQHLAIACCAHTACRVACYDAGNIFICRDVSLSQDILVLVHLHLKHFS
jgi:hypothetical protein